MFNNNGDSNLMVYVAFGLLLYWGFMIYAPMAKSAEIYAFKDEPNSSIEYYIKGNEGFSNTVYLDTRGNLTVGYGHKLNKKQGYIVGNYVSNAQIDIWFLSDFNTAIRCARRFLNNNYNNKELMVVTDMAFNLGCNGLNEFKLFRKHINNKNYIMARKAIRYSNYYKQVKRRALRNMSLLNI